MDSSAPSILPPQVRAPSTPSTLLSIYIDLCHVEKTKINKKRPGLSHFLKERDKDTKRKNETERKIDIKKEKDGVGLVYWLR